jgi:general secretion pathway protein F/type IV pilus assembly protein PilC
MPVFAYKALTEQGKKISGVIDADSFYLAKEKLKKRDVFLLELSEFNAQKKEAMLSSSLLLNFTRELSQLLRAGLPLYESLLTIEEKYRSHRSHSLFIALCDHLKSGGGLSSALQSFPKTFDNIYLSMVKAAEQSGRLSEVFVDLSYLISKQNKLKKQLFAALAYPAFLGGFCFITVVALFFFVIPSMAELFEGRTLHPLTQTVLSISQFLTKNQLILCLFACFSSVALFFSFKNVKIKQHMYSVFIKMPYAKDLLMLSSLVRFFRAMHLLLSGGVPLLEALKYAKKTMKNPLLENLISDAERKIIEGKKLSELLYSPFMPNIVIRMLSIAEEAGNLQQTMKNLADIFEEELDKSLQQLTTFLQPAVLLFLGFIIGVVVLSILLPLTDVSSFLSS